MNIRLCVCVVAVIVALSCSGVTVVMRDGSWSSSTSNKKTQELDESATIKDAVEFNAEYKTEEYLQYKYTARGYRQRYTDDWGYESDCFEIEIYVDGKLVYRRQKDKSPEYFIVTRM